MMAYTRGTYAKMLVIRPDIADANTNAGHMADNSWSHGLFAFVPLSQKVPLMCKEVDYFTLRKAIQSSLISKNSIILKALLKVFK